MVKRKDNQVRTVVLTIVMFFSMYLSGSGQADNFESFDRHRWEEITKGIDYSPNKEEAKEREESDGKQSTTRTSEGGSIFPVGGQALQIIIITVFIVILIIIISKLAGNNLRLRSKEKAGGVQQSLEDIEENLMESDLMKWLKKVVEEKNYRLALRIYYLIIIKELATHGLINWRKEKTNMDYLYEMKGHDTYNYFEEITGIYQLIWYGEKDLGDKYLVEMSHKFRSYYQSINQQANG
ncbi:hypothetical protein LVD17_23675 [Fulvivirga ulvae]|uniref:hypothetical protein n=1 Tax=Fulvivirga ulvae TaxID=2904245 RepID=UPI001F220BD6|nr:hypothetical protein [Fulvivirga ulvae]UII31296.1 hypothetical protein LVD17_23675 [Fulvivirga ulvae]